MSFVSTLALNMILNRENGARELGREGIPREGQGHAESETNVRKGTSTGSRACVPNSDRAKGQQHPRSDVPKSRRPTQARHRVARYPWPTLFAPSDQRAPASPVPASSGAFLDHRRAQG